MKNHLFFFSILLFTLRRAEGKCFAILNRKIIVSMEKFMLPRKMLNIIVFCKAQHNA